MVLSRVQLSVLGLGLGAAVLLAAQNIDTRAEAQAAASNARRATAINPGEATEEKVSLSDRFGLWLGFHNASQDDYLEMVRAYVAHFGLQIADAELQRDALEWSTTRGARSGRVAWQYVQDLAGRLKASTDKL